LNHESATLASQDQPGLASRGTITSTLHVDAVVGGVAGRFQVPIQALSEGTALHAMAPGLSGLGCLEGSFSHL